MVDKGGMHMDRGRAMSIVAEYARALRAELGAELDRLVLYGSLARGTWSEQSDIDVLCVVKGPVDTSTLIRRTSKVTATLSLEHDVVLSRTFASTHDYASRALPFYLNVRREGVPV